MPLTETVSIGNLTYQFPRRSEVAKWIDKVYRNIQDKDVNPDCTGLTFFDSYVTVTFEDGNDLTYDWSKLHKSSVRSYKRLMFNPDYSDPIYILSPQKIADLVFHMMMYQEIPDWANDYMTMTAVLGTDVSAHAYVKSIAEQLKLPDGFDIRDGVIHRVSEEKSCEIPDSIYSSVNPDFMRGLMHGCFGFPETCDPCEDPESPNCSNEASQIHGTSLTGRATLPKKFTSKHLFVTVPCVPYTDSDTFLQHAKMLPEHRWFFDMDTLRNYLSETHNMHYLGVDEASNMIVAVFMR